MHTCVLSYVQLFMTPWPVAHKAALSMGFPKQEFWSGLPFPPPGNLPNPMIKLTIPVSPTSAVKFLTGSTIWEAHRVQNWPQFQASLADLGTHPFQIRRSIAYSQCPSFCAHFHLYYTKPGLYNISILSL